MINIFCDRCRDIESNTLKNESGQGYVKITCNNCGESITLKAVKSHLEASE